LEGKNLLREEAQTTWIRSTAECESNIRLMAALWPPDYLRDNNEARDDRMMDAGALLTPVEISGVSEALVGREIV